jgi:hypothetical protein
MHHCTMSAIDLVRTQPWPFQSIFDHLNIKVFMTGTHDQRKMKKKWLRVCSKTPGADAPSHHRRIMKHPHTHTHTHKHIRRWQLAWRRSIRQSPPYLRRGGHAPWTYAIVRGGLAMLWQTVSWQKGERKKARCRWGKINKHLIGGDLRKKCSQNDLTDWISLLSMCISE